jgi:hypothetical protein
VAERDRGERERGRGRVLHYSNIVLNHLDVRCVKARKAERDKRDKRDKRDRVNHTLETTEARNLSLPMPAETVILQPLDVDRAF